MKSSKKSFERQRQKKVAFIFCLVCARVKEEFKKKERKSEFWV